MGKIDCRQADPNAVQSPPTASTWHEAMSASPARAETTGNDPYAYYSDPVFERGSLRGGVN